MRCLKYSILSFHFLKEMYHSTYRSFYLREFRGTYETHMGVNLITIINVTLLILPCGDDAEDVLKEDS